MITAILVILAVLLAIPTAVLGFEVLLALLPARRAEAEPLGVEGPVAVVIPAHDESAGIAQTVVNIKRELRSSDMLLVVADNCTDDTAAVAAGAGAEVVERHDLSLRGKGYALDFGVRHVMARHPAAIVIIDADCTVKTGTIAALAAASLAWQRPSQARNIMKAPPGLEQRYAIAEFAWLLRNIVRPSGLDRVGLPCQMMGTGMALPSTVLSKVSLASGSIVEDLELGFKLARLGHAPRLCREAEVLSHFPRTEEGALRQRQRWEQGSLAILLRHGVATIAQALAQGNVRLLAMGLDVLVPPIVIHAGAILVGLAVTGLCWLLGLCSTRAPLAMLGIALAFALAICLAWWRYGREALPPRLWLALVPHVLAKLKVYRGFGGKKAARWVRADRSQRDD
jgi:cellulose synthase/poly-beta-1,6-N-acetylglucosamine synthase-like glycosyltransferase